MKKTFLRLTFIITIVLFLTSCNIEVGEQKDIPEDIALKEAEKITTEQGKYLNDIEFGIGDSGEELVSEWGPPIEADYFNGGLYLKYEDVDTCIARK